MIPIAKPLIGPEEKEAVLNVLASGQLAQGEIVAEFERKFAEYLGVKHAVATFNGTTALQASLLALNLSPGDEIITTPFTFIATANAIKMAGAKPVFVDVEEDSFNLDPELIAAAITEKTTAILPVHLFGLPAKIGKIKAIAERCNLKVIEDSCQAHGAEIQGKKVGGLGHVGCFSFYPTKNMTTGEGGMITTNDESVAAKVRKIINHGSSQKYFHDFCGYNFRMTNLQAALGIEQLKKLPDFNQKREKNAFFLNQQLKDIKGVILPKWVPGRVFHQYTIRITEKFKFSRDDFSQILTKNGIGNSIFYPLPVHLQRAYSEYNQLSFPLAEKLAQQVLSLPVHPSLSLQDLITISEAFL